MIIIKNISNNNHKWNKISLIRQQNIIQKICIKINNNNKINITIIIIHNITIIIIIIHYKNKNQHHQNENISQKINEWKHLRHNTFIIILKQPHNNKIIKYNNKYNNIQYNKNKNKPY